MANINLDIGTRYNGDGFKKLDTAMRNSAQTARRTTSAIGNISNAMSGASGPIGKTAGMLSKITGAFAEGGPWALVIAGVTSFIAGIKKAHDQVKQFYKDYVASINAVDRALFNQFKMQQKLAREEEEANRKKMKKQVQAGHEYRDFEKKDNLENVSVETKRKMMAIQREGFNRESGEKNGDTLNDLYVDLDNAKFEGQ